MNYRKLHDSILNNAISRSWTKTKSNGTYVENHHIVPRSSGGTDDSTNLVYLTAREHYLIHWLLYKINPTRANASAWHCFQMKGMSEGRRYTSHSFKYAREAKSKSMTGVKRDPSIGRKVSASQKGKIISKEQRLNHSKLMKGRKHSEEHRINISKGLLGGRRTLEQKLNMSNSAPKTAVIKLGNDGVNHYYPSVNEAASYDKNARTGISKCITGSRKTYKGEVWIYAAGDLVA